MSHGPNAHGADELLRVLGISGLTSLRRCLGQRVRISLTDDLLDGCVGDEAEIIFVGPDIDMLIHVSVSRV
jgi:hypothetical protein